jgi:hypothetical protein
MLLTSRLDNQSLAMPSAMLVVPSPSSPKLQTTIATSSMEAEFVTGVSAAKVAKYL